MSCGATPWLSGTYCGERCRIATDSCSAVRRRGSVRRRAQVGADYRPRPDRRQRHHGQPVARLGQRAFRLHGATHGAKRSVGLSYPRLELQSAGPDHLLHMASRPSGRAWLDYTADENLERLRQRGLSQSAHSHSVSSPLASKRSNASCAVNRSTLSTSACLVCSRLRASRSTRVCSRCL